MIPADFEYFAPTTVEEALGLLSAHREEAKVLAGGHSLIPLLKLRLAAPGCVIDLGRIPALTAIAESDGGLSIGAMVTHYAIESSDLLRARCPLLPETAAEIGDVQVRNKGTIGGSLVHADPAADWPAAILAAGAQLKVRSQGGERTVRAEDFFVEMMTTDVQPDEILTEVLVPTPPPRTGGAYAKVRQPASGFAVVGVAVQVTLDGSICQGAGVGITGLSAKPFRARAVEEALVGQALDAATLRAAAERAAEGVEPLEDLYASAEYRAHLARVYTRRALERAVGRV